MLGIHIDDDFLNIVHLEHTASGLQVHGSTTELLEKGAVKDGLIVQNDTIVQMIRNFLRVNKLKASKAIMSPSCSIIRLRPSRLSAQTDEQLQRKVEEQIGKYALFESEEVVFDYCVFEETAQTSDKQTVLQAVTTRRISDSCLAVAQQAKLDLVRIEPSVLPIMKVILGRQPAESHAVSLLLTLDSKSGNMIVFKAGLPQLCQNLSIGIKGILQERNDCECLIDQITPMLEFAHSLADSQQLVLRVAASCSRTELVTTVDLIKKGLGGVTIEQIDTGKITEQFDLKGDDIENLPIFAFVSALTALCVCKFDGQLNLVSQKSRARKKTQKEMSLMAKAIVAIVLLSIAAVVPLRMKLKNVVATSAEIETKIAEIMPMKEKIAELKKQIKKLNEKQSVYAQACGKLTAIPWPKALKAIGTAVPDGVRIVDISTTNSADLTLVGEALGESYVYGFAKELKENMLFENAKVEEIEYDNAEIDSVVDYKITCKLTLPTNNL